MYDAHYGLLYMMYDAQWALCVVHYGLCMMYDEHYGLSV